MPKADYQKLELLYNYYEKTCGLCKKAEERRNRAFLIQFVIIGVLFYILFFPDNASKTLSSFSINNMSIDLHVGTQVICLLLCMIEVYYLIRYIQLNIYTEKIYKNIHETESQLSRATNYSSICREGKNYLNYYPLVQTIIYLLYSYFFPVLLTLLVSVFCIISLTRSSSSFVTVLFIVLSAMHLSLTILYIKFRWTNAKRNRGKGK